MKSNKACFFTATLCQWGKISKKESARGENIPKNRGNKGCPRRNGSIEMKKKDVMNMNDANIKHKNFRYSFFSLFNKRFFLQ